jgi:hypothetical protein
MLGRNHQSEAPLRGQVCVVGPLNVAVHTAEGANALKGEHASVPTADCVASSKWRSLEDTSTR